ncbi:MAG TPA: ATP-dependent DNA helicase RecQ [Thermoanaerobaculia bacterium]|nr:ATP-dependent DNA helicase RecQ [Thermoanaerobaculia bacterium]
MEPRTVLQSHFGHGSFRPGQEDIVRAALAGRDLLAVMPTGSGKSIGYQLPALLLEGPTLVVSPLIALMKDQVDELTRKGIPAAALHSLASPAARREAEAAMRAGRLRLLYVAPERFGSEAFRRLLAETPIARFAVDEAHCVSEWGHDFRPDYRVLAQASESCRRADGTAGRPPILAFTATATPEVRDDIVSLLGLREPDVFVAGFDRPNLFLDVRKVSGEIEKRTLLPELVGRRRALVYAATRKTAARAAEALRAAGLDAEAYHAGMDEAGRTRVQNRFADGSLPIVCATNAFGMGIDRPDVEAVVHFELPGSLEAYYQEIGRGGRDGRRAGATLLWNYVDVRTREFLIEQSDDAPGRGGDAIERDRKRDLDHRKLARMIAYADSSGCYRATILGYFGERDTAPACGFCGNCARRRDLSEDDLLRLRKILSGVARGGERWGTRKIVAMLTGNLEGLPEPLARLSTTGILGGESPAAVTAWIDAAQGGGLLTASDDVYRTLSLTRAGRDVMAGRTTAVALTLPETARPKARRKKAAAKSAEATKTADPVSLEALREWRRAEAARRAVPAYVVFHDRTLAALAAARPSTLDALSEIPGIGPAKLAAYGKDLLALFGAQSGA